MPAPRLRPRGFTVQDSAGVVTRTPWLVNYWTAGPLNQLSADTIPPRISYYPVTQFSKDRPVGFWQKLGYYVVGGAVGASAASLACVIR